MIRSTILTPIALFVFITAGLILTGPSRIDICDGQTRFHVACSLFDHADTRIRDPQAEWVIFTGRNGQRYSTTSLPHSLLALPTLALADYYFPDSTECREIAFVWTTAWITGLSACCIYFWFLQLQFSPRKAVFFAVTGILCTPLWYYGTSTFDEAIGAFLALAIITLIGLNPNPKFKTIRIFLSLVLLAIATNAKPTWAIWAIPVWLGWSQFSPGIKKILWLIPIGCAVLIGWYMQQLLLQYCFPPETQAQLKVDSANYLTPWAESPFPGWISLLISPGCGVMWYCPAVILMFIGMRSAFHQYPSGRKLIGGVVLAMIGFWLFLGFVSFFKGDLCWGPRYLTPLLAVGWLFVPLALPGTFIGFSRLILLVSFFVQAMAISVDPHRLYIEREVPPSITAVQPWVSFNPALAQIVQRPREILQSQWNSESSLFQLSHRVTSMPWLLFPYDQVPNREPVPLQQSRLWRLDRQLIPQVVALQTFRSWPISFYWLHCRNRCPVDYPRLLAICFGVLCFSGITLYRLLPRETA